MCSTVEISFRQINYSSAIPSIQYMIDSLRILMGDSFAIGFVDRKTLPDRYYVETAGAAAISTPSCALAAIFTEIDIDSNISHEIFHLYNRFCAKQPFLSFDPNNMPDKEFLGDTFLNMVAQHFDDIDNQIDHIMWLPREIKLFGPRDWVNLLGQQLNMYDRFFHLIALKNWAVLALVFPEQAENTALREQLKSTGLKAQADSMVLDLRQSFNRKIDMIRIFKNYISEISKFNVKILSYNWKNDCAEVVVLD